MRKLSTFLLGASILSGCASGGPTPLAKGSAIAPGVTAPTATDSMLAGIQPQKLGHADALDAIDKTILDYFAARDTRRAYIQTDKPLYQPGETIWVRADLRQTKTLTAAKQWNGMGVTMQLTSPRGAVVAQKRVQLADGVAANDFALAPDIDGGEYTLAITGDDGTRDERKVIVNTYEAPRLKKSVELLKKAYGEGDTVTAALEIHLATGEAFAQKTMTGVVTVDDVEVTRVPITTDAAGKATAKFTLPAHIARGDGLFTVLAEDGGVTESTQKRIPIVLQKVSFAMFPEGGDLVAGLPGRVYFSAKNTLGKPADVSGRVVDDRGQTVAKLESIHDGMGRFELEPGADRTYHVELDKPSGITEKFTIPAAKDGGCVLRAVDHDDARVVRAAAMCTTSRSLLVEAVLRDQRVAGGAIDVESGKPTVFDLPIDATAQGTVRVTLFNAKKEPMAERLVYHGRGANLKVEIAADRKSYSPRDKVQLHVHATDAAGKPVRASLGLAVVDDTVLSFADDKTGRILAHLYLEPELGATATDPVEEPNFYFGDKPEATAGLDALLATRGYRRFEWQPVLEPPPPPPPATATEAVEAAPPMDEGAAPRGGAGGAPMPMHHAQPVHRAMAAVATKTPPAGHAMKFARAKDEDRRELAKEVADKPMEKKAFGHDRAKARRIVERDEAGDDELVGQQELQGWAPVRVFPVPQYSKGYEGPRTDFRETIYWNPTVTTNGDGNASVSFFASDAITSFRASVEGVSQNGQAGGGDVVIQSKMPLSLDAHLPVEVSSGDELRLPITLTNETDDALDATLDAKFGAAFALGKDPSGKLHLGAHAKTSLFVPLKVVATDGDAAVHLGVRARGLEDALDKQIHVVPLGFPIELGASGTVGSGKHVEQDFDLAGAMPGTVRATVTMYPSPLAAMTKGMEAMIREPGGCFEQTSSSNYPNVMIMAYLGANDAADAALVQSTQSKLEHGYKLLTGYETPQKGYEWFGHTPGHEALTAYGLMEFADMGRVYDVDHAMVERTADWLMTRRNGKGGFQRSSEALDSFGRADETTTDAYIMWALSEARRTKGLDSELAAQHKLGASTGDPYLLALAANTALLAKDPAANDMVKHLESLQGKDGSFTGAKQSNTMSGGESLAIESTALATLALIKASPADEHEQAIRRAVDFLNAKRGTFGGWSNTQATILGLKAMTAYADHARKMQAPGSATLLVNGERAGTIDFDKGRKDALVWDDLAAKLHPGKNTIALELAGGAALPYSIALEYRSARPASSPAAKVSLHTELAANTVKVGEGIKLRAHIENKTGEGVPMTIARIGIPGGLVFQTWQLKELRDKGVVDFYETRPREVIVYWRALPPGAKKDVELDLLAQTPGTFESPASTAYLYYTAEDKAWTDAVRITVEK